MNSGILIGIATLLILAFSAFWFVFKVFRNEKDLKEFFNGLGDKILEITIETINDTKADEFTSFAVFQQELLQNVYNAIWDYVNFNAQYALEEKQISKAVFDSIDKDVVKDFVNELIDKENLYQTIYNNFAAPKIQTLLENEEPEEEYSEDEYFSGEVVNLEDLEPVNEKQYTEEEISKIIPPTDEENEFVDLEDDSVEIVVDKKEVIQQTTKNGEVRYYEIDEEGNKTRVTENYAKANMEDKNE